MKLFLILLPLILIGCSNSRAVITPVIQDRPRMAIPSLPSADQKPVEWAIITKDNINQRLSTNNNEVLFVLTSQGYQNLSVNVAELRRYIVQQTAIINALRGYYESSQGIPQNAQQDTR